MNLFVGRQESSSWSLSKEVFTNALLARWPGSHVTIIDDPEDIEMLTFAAKGLDGVIEGGLNKEGCVLVMECGSPGDLAEMVVWFRALAPPDDDLVMVNEGGGEYAVITPQTTTADVKTVMGA